MSAQQLLFHWIKELTDHLDTFQSHVSPEENHYQTTWGTFQSHMNALLTSGSGQEAFVGATANAIHTTFSQCAITEQGFQRENVIGRAVEICKTCVVSIESAIADTSPRMTKLDLVEQVLAVMTVDDIVKYGGEMVPVMPFLEYQDKQTLLNPSLPGFPAPDQQARDRDIQAAAQTQEALIEMGNRIQEATNTWKERISALGGEHWPAEFLKQVSEDWNKTNTALELAGKIKIGGFDLKGLGEFMEKKGAYLALIGTLLDFISGKNHKPETLFSDLYGAGLGLLPGVDEITFYTELVHDGAPILGQLQDGVASGIARNDSELRQELAEPAKGIREGGEEFDFGAVLKDLGGVVYNLGPSSLNFKEFPVPFPSYALFHGGERNVPGAAYDLQHATIDSLRMFQGAEKIFVDTAGSMIDDAVGVIGDATHTQGWDHTIIHGVNSVLKWLGG